MATPYRLTLYDAQRRMIRRWSHARLPLREMLEACVDGRAAYYRLNSLPMRDLNTSHNERGPRRDSAATLITTKTRTT